MSTLSDYFSNLATAIRAKTGKSTKLSPNDMIDEIPVVYNTGKSAGVSETKVGTALAGDVLSGKTFTNTSTVGGNGSMTNNGAVSATLNASTTSYTVPKGYHNGSGTVSITTQTKSVTPSSTAQTVTPDSGKVLSSVSVAAAPAPVTQTKSANPKAEETITVTPDSGKLLSSVSIPQLMLTSATTFGSSGYSGENAFKPNRTLSLKTNNYGFLHIVVGELGWFLIALPPKSATSSTSRAYAVNSISYAEFHAMLIPGFSYTNSSGNTSYMNSELFLVKCTDITQDFYIIYYGGYSNKDVNNVYVWKIADL